MYVFKIRTVLWPLKWDDIIFRPRFWSLVNKSVVIKVGLTSTVWNLVSPLKFLPCQLELPAAVQISKTHMQNVWAPEFHAETSAQLGLRDVSVSALQAWSQVAWIMMPQTGTGSRRMMSLSILFFMAGFTFTGKTRWRKQRVKWSWVVSRTDGVGTRTSGGRLSVAKCSRLTSGWVAVGVTLHSPSSLITSSTAL